MNPSELPSETLFEEALKCRTADDRVAYLEQACAGQPELRRRLDVLLKAHDEAGEFLNQPPATLPTTVKVDLAPEEAAGTRIGRYKLLQKIGEGGMGTVYMAEQLEPVVRKVAFKIIKLGMDTRQVVARFEAERQALALMDHPNIARVLDAGATDTGRPYFVMELVHGVPITEYCDKNKLSAKARLELFVPVCQAIQHAHQKGIIHRDIKPSNVMVTLHDGRPVPRVIDFGVAKATNQRLTEKTLFTNYAQMIGTPAYMSPEQAEMSGLDIDTRSDVYALGVLLYELLTGTTPFSAKDLLSKGYVEMQRIIAEQEPPKPSTRMSTMANEERTVVANNRSMNPSSLHKVLQGDLDWIVMKCLEKDRTRRYETSNALAADLQRHLSNELIAARPPTAGYMLAKLIRRNKLLFGAASAVVAALAIGLSLATWMYLKQAAAYRQAEKSEAEAKRRLVESESITKFLKEVLQSPDPHRDGRTITVAEILERAARRLETRLADQPARRADLQLTVAESYLGLGLDREAIPLLEKVLTFYRAGVGPNDPNTLRAMQSLADAYEEAGRQEEALQLREASLPLFRTVLGPEHRDTLRALQKLTSSYSRVGRNQEVLKLREEGLALSRKVLGPRHPDTLGAIHNLAAALDNVERFDEAIQLYEELLAKVRVELKPDHPNTLKVMQNLANTYHSVGRYDESLRLRREVLELLRKVLGPEHRQTFGSMGDLAVSYAQAGQWDEALRLREEVLAASRKALGSQHPDTLLAMHNLGWSYDKAGREAEALQIREQVLPLMRKVYGPEHLRTLRAILSLAKSYYDSGRWDEALKLRDEVVPLYRKVRGREHPDTLEATTDLANSYLKIGLVEEARQLMAEVTAIRQSAPPKATPRAAATNGATANTPLGPGSNQPN